jgi:hypothetical protein
MFRHMRYFPPKFLSLNFCNFKLELQRVKLSRIHDFGQPMWVCPKLRLLGRRLSRLASDGRMLSELSVGCSMFASFLTSVLCLHSQLSTVNHQFLPVTSDFDVATFSVYRVRLSLFTRLGICFLSLQRFSFQCFSLSRSAHRFPTQQIFQRSNAV